MPPCLTLNIIRYIPRVKWNNPGKWVVPSPAHQCTSNWKGSLWITLDYNQTTYYIYIEREIEIIVCNLISSVGDINNSTKWILMFKMVKTKYICLQLLWQNILYLWIGLIGIYGISTIVSYLMPNPLYTYILNMVWLGFMEYQPL